MTHFFKKSFATLALLSTVFIGGTFSLAPAAVHAEETVIGKPAAGTESKALINYVSESCRDLGNCTVCDALKLVGGVAQWLLATIGALALLLVVWGGFTWLTSGGNPEKIKKGKDQILGAAFGMVVLLGAWTFINIIFSIFIPTELGKTPKFNFGTSPSEWSTIDCSAGPSPSPSPSAPK